MARVLETSERGERRFSRLGSPTARKVAKAKAERRQAERARSETPNSAKPIQAAYHNEHAADLSEAVRLALGVVYESPATEATPGPSLDAVFSPGPRARALLRGKAIAEKDLADSGGSYSLDDVRRLLNFVSRQSIEKRVREGRLIAVIGPNNKRFYPVAQFHDDGSVVEGLSQVQDALATRNGYAVLNYLVNPDPRLENCKPIDLLKRGEVGRVVEAAARVGEPGG
jgi:hypothetical protein